MNGLEQLEALRLSNERPPMVALIDAKLVSVMSGEVVFAGTPDHRFYNPLGTVHGGYIATLLDTACGCAGHSMLDASQSYTTLELKIAFHKAVRAGIGLVTATGKVLSLGRRVVFTEARLTDSVGTLYASATSTLMILPR